MMKRNQREQNNINGQHGFEKLGEQGEQDTSIRTNGSGDEEVGEEDEELMSV